MLAWSMSRLKNADCLAKFKKLYITKEVKDSLNPAAKAGIEQHKQLEQYVRHGVPLPHSLLSIKPVIDRLIASAHSYKVEEEFAFTEDWTFVEWFDDQVWCRLKADLLLFKKDVCIYVDYKTGKVDNDPTQAFMTAVAIFKKFLAVDKVLAYNYFTKQNLFISPLGCQPTEIIDYPWVKYKLDAHYPAEYAGGVFHRTNLDSYLELFHQLPQRIYEAYETNEFPYEPDSSSCRFCPAKQTCPVAAR